MRSLRPCLFAILLLPLLATGCQKLFTTSLGEGLQRDSYTIPANISNADAAALIADPSTTPEALASLLSVLNDQAAAGDSSAAALAAEAAVGASGVSETIMPVITEFISSGTGSMSSSDISALVSTIQAGASSEVLAGLGNLSDSATLVAADLSPTELIVAAALLASSALPAGTDPTALVDPELAAYRSDPSVALAATLISSAVSGLSDPSLAQGLADLLNTGA